MATTLAFDLPHHLDRVLILVPPHTNSQVSDSSRVDGSVCGHEASRQAEVEKLHGNMPDQPRSLVLLHTHFVAGGAA